MSTIAIALAGGGPLGGIYEIGACAALSDSINGLRLDHADIYVGVSSGAVVASALANGISPAKLVRILLSDDSGEMFDPATLLRPAFREYADRLTSIPPLAWQSLTYYLAAPWKRSLFESLQGLSKAIPTGLFDNRGVDRTLTQFSLVQAAATIFDSCAADCLWSLPNSIPAIRSPSAARGSMTCLSRRRYRRRPPCPASFPFID